MLKRQRPSSPLLPSSSIPLISDSPGDLIERNAKRRRTLPPVLDGASRGWATTVDSAEEDAYNSEEEENEDEDDGFAFSYPNNQNPSEYKSANTILRELHTLNQHRLLFSSPPPSRSQASPLNSVSYLSSSTQQLQHPVPMKGYVLQQEKQQPTPSYTPCGIEKESQPQLEGTFSEEVSRVTERYETTNKLLGSLFLSRRRDLDSSDGISGT